MQRSKFKKMIFNTFWLSIVFHVFILIYLLLLLKPPPVQENKTLLPHYYVPAYTYSGSIKPAALPREKKSSQTPHQETSTEPNPVETAQKADRQESIIHVLKVVNKKPASKTHLSPESLLADSFNFLKNEQMRELSDSDEPDPIYLIGDDSQPADPLIKLIGQSLSKHFKYPRMAGELGIKGRVLVKLTLHPEGYYSNVQIIKSSRNDDLDAAALYAVNAAPRVYGADRFISKPKRIVIGFIFE